MWNSKGEGKSISRGYPYFPIVQCGGDNTWSCGVRGECDTLPIVVTTQHRHHHRHCDLAISHYPPPSQARIRKLPSDQWNHVIALPCNAARSV